MLECTYQGTHTVLRSMVAMYLKCKRRSVEMSPICIVMCLSVNVYTILHERGLCGISVGMRTSATQPVVSIGQSDLVHYLDKLPTKHSILFKIIEYAN